MCLPNSDLGGFAVLPIQIGDRVRIQYFRVRAVPGKRRVRRAVEFVAGTSNMIPTLSWGVLGMIAGQCKRFTLQPGEAFGRLRPGLVKEVPRYRFPKQLKLQVGQRLTAVQRRSGRRRRVTVVEITPYSVIVDGNHPLAGKAVVVEIFVVAINPRSSSHPPQPDLGEGS
jgi:FKBP-type peptidyl-prolyl cis-trans isomerase 2